jgi:ribonuclease D
VALLQISTCHKDFVIDVFRVKAHITEAMKDIFRDPSVVKIFHGCDSDLQLLAVRASTVKHV